MYKRQSEYWEYEQCRTEYRQHPQYPTPKYSGVQAVSAVQNLEILRVLVVYTPEVLPVLLGTPVAPTERSLLQLPLVGASVNVLCKTMGMKSSTRCSSILNTPSASIYSQHEQYHNGRNTASACSTRNTSRPVVFAVPAVQNPAMLEVQGESTVSNPEILRVRKYPQWGTSKC